MKIFIIILTSTLLELYVLISVGEVIGAFSTILLVILTALIGSILLKYQGRSTLNKAQQIALAGQIPTNEILEGVMLLVSGLLLLTPGFITDFLGLLGLFPTSRRWLITYLMKKQIYQYFMPKKSDYHDPEQVIIETQFWENKH